MTTSFFCGYHRWEAPSTVKLNSVFDGVEPGINMHINSFFTIRITLSTKQQYHPSKNASWDKMLY